jgi:hypothetical protein
MNIHQAAIIIVFSWACAYVLICCLFRREAKLLEKKIMELQNSVRDYLPVLFSVNWLQDSSRHRIIEARREIIVLAIIAPLILALSAISLWSVLGYSMLVGLIGALIFFDAEGLQAYSYSKTIRKMLPERLQKKDIDWMRLWLMILKSKQYLYIFWTILFFAIATAGYILLFVFGK